MNEYPSLTGLPIDKSRVDWLQYCDRGKFIPILYVPLTGGLCNRILGLASCHSKATVESRIIKPYWPLNGQDGCSSNWTDVFSTPIQHFTEWDVYWLMDVAHEVKWHHRLEEAYTTRDTTNIVVVKASYDYFTPQPGVRLSPDYSLATNKEWCNSLQLTHEVLDKVKKFALPHGTLGIHLRVHESNFLNDSLFINDPLTVEVLDSISSWPGPVLVISNSQEHKLRLKAHFGSKILLQEVESYQRDSSGAISAITDVVLMAMCKKRIGNWASTLYRLACYWSERTDFTSLAIQ